MDIYTTADFPHVYDTIAERILSGEVCILGTDTIYGLSGNALDEKVIDRIQNIKQRSNPPALIPHSLKWLRLLIQDEYLELFDREMKNHYGRFLTLWPYSNRWVKLSDSLCSSGLVGVRFPIHWTADFAERIGIPLVTTSVNIHLQPCMTSLDNLNDAIREQVDFMVYEGPLYGPPSTLVHCDGKEKLRYGQRN